MQFHKRHPQVGARPGTLVIPPGAPPPRIVCARYSSDTLHETEITDVRDLPRPGAEDGVCWVDVRGLGDEAMLRAVGEHFDIHPLALEDAVNVPQRAKSELYENHQLVIARCPIPDEHGIREVPQVCLLVGKGYLVTFQERFFGFFEPVRERLRAGIGPIRRLGPDYLAYALLDTLVDRYYPIAEDLSERLDVLEERILDDPATDILGEIHDIRRQVAILRRVGWPQREAVTSLVREHTPFLSDEVRVFLRDTSDHIAQIMEMMDSAREMAVGVSEIYLSNLSQRSNEVMKVLTVMASIFIPLTFIAGVYGMNFQHMPELATRIGYFLVLGAMGSIALGMVLYFRHRGWIGGPRRRRRGRARRRGT